MTSREIAEKAARVLDAKIAQNIKVIRIDEISSLGDYFVIATGNSSTQVTSLADHVEEKLKEAGVAPYAVEGYRSNGWVLLDYTSVLVHIFTTDARDYYDLDRLWGDGEEIKIDFTAEN